MRWILLLVLFAFPVCTGCDKSSEKTQMAAKRLSDASSPEKPQIPSDWKAGEVAETSKVAGKEKVVPNQLEVKAPEAGEKKEKPRKIRYTADMKVIVEKLDDAEEKLDAIRDKFDGDYEKAEVNRSANVIRSGTWKVRVPVKNLAAFRKAVAKIGDVEKDTLDSDDMTTKYYDLERHIANLKAREKSVREFLTEIGKKDPRFLEVWRELETITDDIDRKEGTLELWANLTDLTTFTIHIRELEKNDPRVVKTKEDPPAFGDRIEHAWTGSWEAFLGFCQRITIAAVWVAPWSPLVLVAVLGLWLMARRMGRHEAIALAAVAAAPTPDAKKT